jgi:hypothetical protein
VQQLSRRLGALAMTGGAAALILAGTPALASTAYASTPVPGVNFSSNAITCPTATTCLAGGSDSSSGAVIVVINGATGAATPAGTDASMNTVGGIACATATQCVAAGWVGDAVSVNGANGATGTNHAATTGPIPIFYTVACPSAGACYGGGTHVVSPTNHESTLTALSPAGVPGATSTGQASALESLACVSASRCYAAIASPTGGAVEVISNGAVSKSFPLPFDAFAITCVQAASCEVAGSNGSTATAYAATVNPVTGKPGPAHAISGMTQVSGLACATSTECFVVGFLSGSSAITSAVSDVENGTPQPAKKAPGSELSGVACPTATTCWAIGQNSKSGIVVPVQVA